MRYSKEQIKAFKERVFTILEPATAGDKYSKLYDWAMLGVIALSLVPVFTHSDAAVFVSIDIFTCIIFIFDYIFRWLTADIAHENQGKKAFLLYPVTPMAIVDLLSILPTLSLISPVFKVFRVSRLFKLLRIVKFVRYYEPLQIMVAVIKRERKTLGTVLLFAVFYIIICAMVMFNVETDPSFDTFFDALYWSCCTLTTVGYGDIIPVSTVGRAFSMISSIVGIALIALPSGILTSGYMEELRIRKEEKEARDKEQ